MIVRTWHVELTVVTVVLSLTALLSGGGVTQWLGVAAVALTFAHTQIAQRLVEREAARDKPTVECYQMLNRYFMAKEMLWSIYFVLLGAWPALVGVFLFMVYPAWRGWWRLRHPLDARTPWTGCDPVLACARHGRCWTHSTWKE